jgi:hypothetical protein
MIARLVLGLSFASLLVACSPAPAPAAAPRHPTPYDDPQPAPRASDPSVGALEDWPKQARVGEGRGPGLFLGPESNAPSFGFLSEGVALEIAGLPERGRIPVRVRSGMRVRGYFPMQRLEAVVLQRGRIRDTPIYVGPSDRVRVLGGAGGGRTLVSVTPRLVSTEGVPVALPSYEGSFPAVGLGADVMPGAEPVPGTPIVIRGEAPVQVYDSPGGRLLVTLPPAATFTGYEVRRDGGMSAVLLGDGPYLAGYVSITPITSTPKQKPAPRGFAAAGVPERIRENAEGSPLFRVAAGTRVTFDGVTIASVDELGWAWEIVRYDETGEVDVLVAVDDAVAVRGMVPVESLRPPAASP